MSQMKNTDTLPAGEEGDSALLFTGKGEGRS